MSKAEIIKLWNKHSEYLKSGSDGDYETLSAVAHDSYGDVAEELLEDFAKPQWISVKDRLPENHSSVLIYSKHSGIVKSWFSNYNTTYGTEFRDKDRNILDPWFCSSGSKQYSKTRGNITHWQPLPTPPNEK